MKKQLRVTLTALMLLVNVLALPVGVHAHEGEDHPNTAQTQPLDVPEVKTEEIPQSSGYVDKDGNPISVEEYNKQREQATKSIVERQPVASAVVGLLLACGLAWGAFKLFGKKGSGGTPRPA